MVKNKDRLHVSDLLYLIYTHMGNNIYFSNNDVYFIVSISNLANLKRGSFTRHTGISLPSIHKTGFYVKQWCITDYGLTIMHRYAMKDKMNVHLKELYMKQEKCIEVSS
jgi:hypothetical protein